MTNKKKIILPVLAITLLTGAGIGISSVSAQTQSTSTTTGTSTAGITAKVKTALGRFGGGKMGPHIDGNVTAINGTTITLTEEADEGSTVYTVDASAAKFLKAGVAGALTDIKIGDKIFVEGTATGGNVVATQVMAGMPGGGRGHHGAAEVGQ